MTEKILTNPLVMVTIGLLILLIVLGIIRVFMPSFNAGIGLHANFGTIKGGFDFETFENENENMPSLVIFKAEWCGHCKKIMPEIQKLIDTKLENVKIVVIDSDKQPELIKQHGVQGFPTIRMYPQGLSNKDTYKDFDGERNVDGFKTFLDGFLGN